ncbi:MAG: FtsX-like permease family protein [Spirochaetia bacterium]|nr:MAG: FtsX-like permease family protein [Spirochaetia bacterium]
MTLRYTFKTAIIGLRTHKSRSALTILGIVIGITAIMLVLSLGEGAQNLILSQIQSIGPKVITAVPGKQPKGPTDIFSMFADSLKQKDLDALSQKSNVPHAEKIMPIVFGSESLAYGNDTYRATIFGATEIFAGLYDIYPDKGRNFNEDDVKSYSNSVIIGSKIESELFGGEEALGKKVKIKGINFRVVGILPQKGQFSFLNFDEVAIVPYTTAQQYIFGRKYFDRFVVEADTEANVPATVEDVKITLRNSHNITDPGKDDFFIETQAQAMETVGTITNVLTMFLAAVAAISLLVGGVGIMNIMLVSVTERTREIGLRKAIGATEKNVLFQFLLESVILTALGGLIGIILGTSLSAAIALVLSKVLVLDWGFVFPLSGALMGLGVAALTGLVFGLYPARQASKKSPIEALRYE